MFSISVSDAAKICRGKVYGLTESDPEIKRVVIDSRNVKKGDMFVAFKGENSDGHDYIISALKKGAVCALAEHLPPVMTINRDDETIFPGPVIICDNVQTSIELLAAEFRKRIDIPVIGITGSVGKTSAKEMISAVLSQRFKVRKTIGNLNNTIGLPMSVCSIDKNDECAVMEMGINHFGEMRRLGAIAAPNIAVFTVIGHAHLEFLGDLSGVLKAKTEMLESMEDEALVIINGDDPYLMSFDCPQWRLTFGKGKSNDVRATSVKFSDGKTCLNIHYQDRVIKVEIPAFGEHMVYAALAGAAVGFAMGLSDDEIVKGIKSYEVVGRRFSVENTGYIKLIDDCYNANPDSMKSSINSLMGLKGRHVCIFGDMLELGREAPAMHDDIGKYAKETGVEVLIGVGKLGQLIAEAFGGIKYDSINALIEDLPWLINEDDIVLVKASRGSHLEAVSESLKGLKLSKEN